MTWNSSPHKVEGKQGASMQEEYLEFFNKWLKARMEDEIDLAMQPERLNLWDASNSVCDSLNTIEI